ncbi:MAG: cytochrome c, partial [Proteobacteria bacterium]|nr:cytochrome c [Pseudomonadota bacterium]
MTRKKPSLAFAIPLLGLALGACSQEQPGAPAASDTAVHDAEAAVATADDLMAKGREVYNANCAACHQPDGSGLTGAFPPLAGSDYLQGDRKAVLSAAMFGLSGPITVNGVEYNGVMPSLGHLPDEDLAAALTYVLGSWGNDGAAVSVAEVAALRAELGKEDRAEGQRHVVTEGEL